MAVCQTLSARNKITHLASHCYGTFHAICRIVIQNWPHLTLTEDFDVNAALPSNFVIHLVHANAVVHKDAATETATMPSVHHIMVYAEESVRIGNTLNAVIMHEEHESHPSIPSVL